jgi:hypothetical protein
VRRGEEISLTIEEVFLTQDAASVAVTVDRICAKGRLPDGRAVWIHLSQLPDVVSPGDKAPSR